MKRVLKTRKWKCLTSIFYLFAEGEGFKPPIPERGISIWKSTLYEFILGSVCQHYKEYIINK